MALADQSGAIKGICSEKFNHQLCVEGKTVILRNYVIGKSVLFLKENTTITHTADKKVPQDKIDAALQIINPTTPPRKPVKDVALDAGLTTVQGILETVSKITYTVESHKHIHFVNIATIQTILFNYKQ